MCWEVIVGTKNIAKRFGYSRQTMENWANKHEFPMSYLPDGSRAISTVMINDWLYARRKLRMEKYREKAIRRYEQIAANAPEAASIPPVKAL